MRHEPKPPTMRSNTIAGINHLREALGALGEFLEARTGSGKAGLDTEISL
jgi:hypothetical protein